MEEIKNPEKQDNSGRDKNGRFLPGVSGNPNGRPRNKTFRDYFDEEEEADLICRVKEVLKDRPEILKLAVEQIFGKPKQQMELDANVELQIPIYGGISKHDSDKEDISTEEED